MSSGPQAPYQGQPGVPGLPPVPRLDSPSDRTRRAAWYGTLTGIAVLLALFLGLKASGLLQSRAAGRTPGMLQAVGESPNNNLLSSQGEQPSGLLESRGQGPGNSTLEAKTGPSGETLESKAPVDTPMPADVREWLEHLRRTEEKRVSLATDQIAEAVVLMTELQGLGASSAQVRDLLGGDDESGDGSGQAKSSVDTALEKTRGMQQEWPKLVAYFESKEPPAECRSIKEDYDQALRETGAMINDIIDIVVNSGDNPMGAIAKLEKMKGKSKNLIDRPALSADDGVADICRKYKTRKWFDIQGDTGSGLMKVF